MGGGNGQKSKTAKDRARKQKDKAAKQKQRQSSDFKNAQQKNKEAWKCMKCMQPFPSTSSKSTLAQHVDSKHSKFSFEQCFPTYGQDSAGSANDDKNKKNNYGKNNYNNNNNNNNGNKGKKKNKKKGKK
mmetsp:Transcript_41650/g.36846  ORF Transcript_41650/g.36846 Transcript_41650/m.36846 type:complete len:129 (+) Transcript_41650:68-454(+)